MGDWLESGGLELWALRGAVGGLWGGLSVEKP